MNKDFKNLLNKYECKLVDDIIINKNGNDTKIVWKSFIQLEENLKLRLDGLAPKAFSETNASITENLNKELKYRAFPRGLYVI